MGAESGWENVTRVAFRAGADALVGFPVAHSHKIDLDAKDGGLVGTDVQHLLIEGGHQVRVGRVVLANVGVPPGTAPAGGLAPTPQVVGLAEPDPGLRLAGHGVVVAVGRGLVTADSEQAAERAIVGNGAQVLADGLDAPHMVQESDGLEFVEHALYVHQVMLGFHLTDAHPLGLPRLAESLAGFGQAEALPLAFHERPEQHRRLVPTGGEENRTHVLARGHVHVRLAGEAIPGLAVEFEKARLVVAILVEAVIGHDDTILRGEGALEMGAGGQFHFLHQVEQGARFEVVDIHLAEDTLHGLEVDAVGGIGQVAHGGSDAVLVELGDVFPVAPAIDGIRADEALVRFAVDQAVGVRAVVHVDAFGLERLVNPVEAKPVAGALHMAVVGDRPQRVRPGHEGADAGLGALGKRVGLEADIGLRGRERLGQCHAGTADQGRKQ